MQLEHNDRYYFLLEWLEIIDLEKATLGKFLTEPFKTTVRNTVGLKRWTRNVQGGEQTFLYLSELVELAKVSELPAFLIMVDPKKLDKSQQKEFLKFAIMYMLKCKKFINPKVFELLHNEELKERTTAKDILLKRTAQ